MADIIPIAKELLKVTTNSKLREHIIDLINFKETYEKNNSTSIQ